ncbi:hypothetical protein [Candidatus Tisiphia endosymbiont of Beris chalybata]|uniref:hypothetical protein n=1 Tax=Candidatus Tisiphia endosymbiont of Beris chalybata TaxID=3066262 RepID=UPI00312CB865
MQNSKDPALKSIVLNILKGPLGLLTHLAPEAHSSLIASLFNLLKYNDPELRTTVLNILKDPLDLLGHLQPHAHPNFITKLFDLLSSKDSELKAIACTLLKEPITLLARLSPGAYHSFMPKLFSLLNSQDQSLKLIALTALQTPIELFKVLDIKDRKAFQQKYSSFDKVLTKDQEKLKAFVSDEALAIDQAGYATIDDLKNLSVDKIASFTSKEAKTVYESGGTLTFMLNYSLDTNEGKKLLELYSQGKKEEADKYQIIECTKNMVAAYLLVASPKLVLFSQTMDKFIDQLAISKIGTKESTANNKQQVREEIKVVLENSLKILIENPVQQGLLRVALQFMEVHDLSKHVSKKNILPDSTE